MMGIINSPTTLLAVGIACVVLYSLGQYGRSRYRDYFRVVGFGGTALVLVKLFWSMCPAHLFGYLFPMLAAALISPAAIWILRAIKTQRNRQRQFSFARGRTFQDKPVEKQTGGEPAPHPGKSRVNPPVLH